MPLMSSTSKQTPPSAEAPGDSGWSPYQNLLHRSINLSSPWHTGWQYVSPKRWTCIICRDGVVHHSRHLSRHLDSRRHRQTVGYVSQLPLLTDQDESEHASMYVAQSSDEVILNVDAPPTVNDIPAEVSYGLHLCDRRLMAFTG